MIRKVIAIALIATAAHAEELKLEDGRRIELHTDGTWTYVSTDRLLGTADGRQVRLREDGTWEYTGAMAPGPSDTAGEITRGALGETVFAVKELAIETARTSVHKSSRKKTETVFLLSLSNIGEAASQLTLDPSVVQVEDSAGRKYPVISVEPQSIELQPGDNQAVAVRADGSPHWFTTRYMEVHLFAGTDKELVLKSLLADASKRELEDTEH